MIDLAAALPRPHEPPHRDDDDANSDDGERIVHEVADLALVYQEGVDVVRLVRGPLPDLAVLAARPFQLSMRGHAGTLDLDAAFPGDRSGAASFVRADVARWAEVLADLLDAREVGVRLVAGPRPMCPQFHVDHVALRLVVAYVGAGTEWIGRATRAANPSVSACVRAAASSRLRRASCGDVVVMKGEGNGVGRGVVHRSPPHDENRLLVSIDALA